MTVDNINGLIKVSGTEEEFKDKIKHILAEVVAEEMAIARKSSKDPDFWMQIMMITTLIAASAGSKFEEALLIGIEKEEN